MAARSDFNGVVRRLRDLREQRAHFFFRLKIKLIAPELHAILVLNGMVGLNTQKDAVHFAVFRADIMAVVCHDKRNPRFTGDSDNGRIDQFLFPEAVIL